MRFLCVSLFSFLSRNVFLGALETLKFEVKALSDLVCGKYSLSAISLMFSYCIFM